VGGGLVVVRKLFVVEEVSSCLRFPVPEGSSVRVRQRPSHKDCRAVPAMTAESSGAAPMLFLIVVTVKRRSTA
jgi:hypothetical protein